MNHFVHWICTGATILRNAALATALISLATLIAEAGDVTGSGCDIDRVLAFESSYYSGYYTGGELAVIRLSGDGDTDLDLFVYDESGKLIESGEDVLDEELVSWTPLWTGEFTIEVRNLGSVWNEYSICTN